MRSPAIKLQSVQQAKTYNYQPAQIKDSSASKLTNSTIAQRLAEMDSNPY